MPNEIEKCDQLIFFTRVGQKWSNFWGDFIIIIVLFCVEISGETKTNRCDSIITYMYMYLFGGMEDIYHGHERGNDLSYASHSNDNI